MKKLLAVALFALLVLPVSATTPTARPEELGFSPERLKRITRSGTRTRVIVPTPSPVVVAVLTEPAAIADPVVSPAPDVPLVSLPVAVALASEPESAVPVHEPVHEPPAHEPADPLTHWGLRESAFDNAPTTRFLYRSPEHNEALFRLRYAIVHRKGGAVLTGTYGCGKTTLARTLARELDPTRFDVALIANPLLTPTALLREFLHQLGEPSVPKEKLAVLHRLQERLAENLRRGRDTVLIVDEAQLIEDEAVFDELRLLLNFQTNDRFLMTLVLAGSDELGESLRRHPHLAQRCGARARLEPLDREQTGCYVRHRLGTAGRDAETLTDEAMDELFAATGGTPRVINAVCDLTLVVGAAAVARRVDGELVRRVADDVVAAHAA